MAYTIKRESLQVAREALNSIIRHLETESDNATLIFESAVALNFDIIILTGIRDRTLQRLDIALALATIEPESKEIDVLLQTISGALALLQEETRTKVLEKVPEFKVAVSVETEATVTIPFLYIQEEPQIVVNGETITLFKRENALISNLVTVSNLKAEGWVEVKTILPVIDYTKVDQLENLLDKFSGVFGANCPTLKDFIEKKTTEVDGSPVLSHIRINPCFKHQLLPTQAMI